jgi:sortase A
VKNTKIKVGILFILIGLVLISIPFYYEWKQQKEVTALEEALAMIANADGEDVDLSSIDNLPFSKEELDGVVELEIPSIHLKQKVLTETTNENLSVALTQIKPNQTPGKNNFTIAGHRGYRGDRHFRNLPEVVKGDEVLLHTKEQTFVYQVNSSEVIEPTEVQVLEDKKGQAEITLITCTIDGKERIATKGNLISTKGK